MSPYLDWCDDLSVGVSSIDEEHKILIGYLNELNEAVLQGKGAEILDQILDNLITYITTHFEHEEEYMVATNYPHFKEHQAEHKQLWMHVMTLQDRRKSENYDALSNEVLAFMKNWIKGHLLYMDKAFAKHFKEHGATE